MLAALALAALSGVLPLASAQAAGSATCPTVTLSQPFVQWGDSNFYSLVPGGDFEGSLTGWSLSGGAARAADSESFAVAGTLGASSLALPPGASAQSPFMCVSAINGTFRFFARSEGTAATVRAQVVYETPIGNLAFPVGTIPLNGAWAPTPALQTGAALASSLSNGTAQLALRFTSLSGTSRIDDVFIDPRRR
jgi:hypothetical protein